MYVCIDFYCYSQFSDLKLHIWAAVFAVQRTLIADGLGLRPINSVASNGGIGYLNKCFSVRLLRENCPNRELSFCNFMRNEINAN